MNQKGFKNVFQLKGGIINYLDKINVKKSLWKGECFVFDNRVSVIHNLIPGSYFMCRGCRMPISQKDMKSNKYKEGIQRILYIKIDQGLNFDLSIEDKKNIIQKGYDNTLQHIQDYMDNTSNT